MVLEAELTAVASPSSVILTQYLMPHCRQSNYPQRRLCNQLKETAQFINTNYRCRGANDGP